MEKSYWAELRINKQWVRVGLAASLEEAYEVKNYGQINESHKF